MKLKSVKYLHIRNIFCYIQPFYWSWDNGKLSFQQKFSESFTRSQKVKNFLHLWRRSGRISLAKIVAYVSCSAGRKHFAPTQIFSLCFFPNACKGNNTIRKPMCAWFKANCPAYSFCWHELCFQGWINTKIKSNSFVKVWNLHYPNSCNKLYTKYIVVQLENVWPFHFIRKA